MSVGKHQRQPKGNSYFEGAEEVPNRKHIRAPELDTCNLLVEAVSPAFDPNRVLLSRVFFIDEDKAKYASVGYYPTRDNQPPIEFGGPKKKPINLNDQQVRTMAEYLPSLCEALCNNEHYICKDGDFRFNSAGGYRFARMYLGKQYLEFKLYELRYLSYTFFMIRNLPTLYTAALKDVKANVDVALTSTTYTC
jgi:hypothetical protein